MPAACVGCAVRTVRSMVRTAHPTKMRAGTSRLNSVFLWLRLFAGGEPLFPGPVWAKACIAIAQNLRSSRKLFLDLPDLCRRISAATPATSPNLDSRFHGNDGHKRLRRLSIYTYTDVSRIARLATLKVARPRLPAKALDQLAVSFRLDHRLQGHFNGLGSSLGSQNPLCRSHQTVIEAKRSQSFCHNVPHLAGGDLTPPLTKGDARPPLETPFNCARLKRRG